jgi:hypothetical protein
MNELPTDPETTELESGKRPDIRTAFIADVTFGPTAVHFEAVDGMAIFQGDIVLGTVEEVEAAARRVRADPALLRADALARSVVTTVAGRR